VQHILAEPKWLAKNGPDCNNRLCCNLQNGNILSCQEADTAWTCPASHTDQFCFLCSYGTPPTTFENAEIKTVKLIDTTAVEKIVDHCTLQGVGELQVVVVPDSSSFDANN
jgi:hypothetical protein